MASTKKRIKWQTSQPPLNEEIVVFANYAKPTYHFVKWNKKVAGQSDSDWDIKLESGLFIGPRNFEGGYQFVPDVKEKEFFWAPRKDFLKK